MEGNLKGINGWLVFVAIALLIFIVVDKLTLKNRAVRIYPANQSVSRQNQSDKVISPYQVKTFDVPDEILFAGEIIKLDKEFKKIKFDRELHVNAYWSSNFLFSMKRAHRWFPIIEKVLREENIPEDMKFLAVIESSLYNSVSPAKAVGFWQLVKPTAKELGLEINQEVDERYNPEKSAKIACAYFKRAYKKFGNWTSVAASYNMGMRGLNNQIKKQKETNYFDLHLNEETSRYMYRILALKELMTNPEKYGYFIPENQMYQPLNLKQVKVEQSIPDLVEFCKAHDITYQELKIYNPWLRKDRLTIKKNKPYYISIPI